MPPRAKSKDDDEVQEVPTPGTWVNTGHNHYEWREGTHQDLDDRHEYPHKIHRDATGLTTEYGTWKFTGVPPMPEGGTEGGAVTAEDLDRQIAELTARRAKL